MDLFFAHRSNEIDAVVKVEKVDLETIDELHQ
jgi:hypothetical protein